MRVVYFGVKFLSLNGQEMGQVNLSGWSILLQGSSKIECVLLF
jgi:hypothetical protein